MAAGAEPDTAPRTAGGRSAIEGRFLRRISSTRLRTLAHLPTAVRYVIATVFVIAALLALFALPKGQSYPFILFLPIILGLAVLLDHHTSIYATFLSTALIDYFVFAHPAGGQDVRDLFWLAVFVATGLAIGFIVEAMRDAVDSLSAANLALVHAQADLRRQGILFDAVLEGTPDPIYVKDRRGRFVHVNPATAALLGAPAPSIVGRADRDFLKPALAAVIEETDEAIMASARGQTLEERVALPGAPERVFLSSKFAWLDADGTVRGLIGMSRDMTDRFSAEAAMKAADAAKQLLLFDINHRIKNHLQTVAGLMDLAARRATTLDAAQLALSSAAGRLAVLGQVYTRLQLGSTASVVDARSFVEELCAGLNTSLIGGRPISIRCDAVTVPLESSRAVTLGLAINEIVQNAVKYAFPDDRAGTIRVRLLRTHDDLVLSVEDDGIGIDHHRAPAGTGAGQRLIRAMAQQLGGTLDIAGPPGTRFTLRFPESGD